MDSKVITKTLHHCDLAGTLKTAPEVIVMDVFEIEIIFELL